MLAAEIALEQGQPQRALDKLRELRARSGHAYGGAAPRGARAAGGAALAEIPPLLDQLVKRKVYDSGAGRTCARDARSASS